MINLVKIRQFIVLFQLHVSAKKTLIRMNKRREHTRARSLYGIEFSERHNFSLLLVCGYSIFQQKRTEMAVIGRQICSPLRALNLATCDTVCASFGSTGIFSLHILHPEIHILTNHNLQKTYSTPLQSPLF
jgi:hypothetical protein